MTAGGIALAELAARLGAEPAAGSTVITRLARLDEAGPEALSFLPSAHYRPLLGASRAGGVLVTASCAAECVPGTALVVKDPVLACALAAHWLPVTAPGHCAAAFCDGGHRPSRIAGDAEVHRSAVVGCGVTIGSGSRIEPGAVVGPDVRIGDYCRIGPHAVLGAGVKLGNRVAVGAGATIGKEGFTLVRHGRQWLRIPSFAAACLDDDVELGAQCTVDRGVMEATRLRRGVKLDNQVHVGHGADVGADTVIAAGTRIGGEARIGAACLIGGGVVIREGLAIADAVVITGGSHVIRPLREPGRSYSSGWPARPSRSWWRVVSRLGKLGEKS
ncbi:MAG: UDP-3-O-(3-hydroxymyristoyl)glucosamine N-acyltransferase [Gammaproteobacteria bacterium]|nr:UDP-3-O-(3-hydroxymyristoyl)glucosamine N-acyltransferase [Gammaproteobacteria bacterium]